MQTTSKLRIATRGSQLALWQANYVTQLLLKRGIHCELNIIKTTGDRVQDRFLHEIGGKGLFVRELEESLLAGHTDLAVHSLKDLPAKTPAGFALAAILPRHLAEDALIFNPKSLARLKIPEGSHLSREQVMALGPLTIATASLRRQALLKALPNPIELVPIRGNVDTRIRKLNEGDWDGLILAGASLERLGLQGLPHRLLDPEWFIPCAAQGALAIETLADSPARQAISALSDPGTYACASLERKVLELLGGDCTMPFAAYFDYDASKGVTRGRALVLDESGREAKTGLSFPGRPESLPVLATALQTLETLKGPTLTSILAHLKITPPDLGKLDP
jgi:hydroxymethylbilane synthase